MPQPRISITSPRLKKQSLSLHQARSSIPKKKFNLCDEYVHTYLLARMHLCALMVRPSTSMDKSAKLSESKIVPIQHFKSWSSRRCVSLLFSAAVNRCLAFSSLFLEISHKFSYFASEVARKSDISRFDALSFISARSVHTLHVQPLTFGLFSVFLQLEQRTKSSPIQTCFDVVRYRIVLLMTRSDVKMLFSRCFAILRSSVRQCRGMSVISVNLVVQVGAWNSSMYTHIRTLMRMDSTELSGNRWGVKFSVSRRSLRRNMAVCAREQVHSPGWHPVVPLHDVTI